MQEWEYLTIDTQNSFQTNFTVVGESQSDLTSWMRHSLASVNASISSAHLNENRTPLWSAAAWRRFVIGKAW